MTHVEFIELDPEIVFIPEFADSRAPIEDLPSGVASAIHRQVELEGSSHMQVKLEGSSSLAGSARKYCKWSSQTRAKNLKELTRSRKSSQEGARVAAAQTKESSERNTYHVDTSIYTQREEDPNQELWCGKKIDGIEKKRKRETGFQVGKKKRKTGFSALTKAKIAQAMEVDK
ncbi:hypothetical protein KSP39_PZI004037 [Platanthera zijinensis]|uniref:Uncharacterized protein n=1 Tax=Platanthera zijinensis TaxID=2320716 RepID=A0AAP0BVT6_9ASPA